MKEMNETFNERYICVFCFSALVSEGMICLSLCVVFQCCSL